MRNSKREVIGVVQVLNKAQGYFTVEDETLLASLATQAAITTAFAASFEHRQR